MSGYGTEYGVRQYGLNIGDNTTPILQNQSPAPGDTSVPTDVDIILEIVDPEAGVNPQSVVLTVLGTVCFQFDTQQGPFHVSKVDITNGYRYTVNPLGLLPDDIDAVIEVYAEDYVSGAPCALSASYSFHTGISEVLFRVPLGAFYAERVQRSIEADRPAICNRIPAPPVLAGLESSNAETYTFDVGANSIVFETGGVSVRVITGDVLDRIIKGTKSIFNVNGSFVSGDVGKTYRVSNSRKGNNKDFTIQTVVDSQHIVVVETPSADEGPRDFLREDMADGIWETVEETLVFLSGDFVDPLAATAAEVVAAINSRAINILARQTVSGDRVHLLSRYGKLEIFSVTGTNLGFTVGQIALDSFSEAGKDDAVSFTVQETGSSGFDRVRVWIRTSMIETLVYDSTGPALAPGWSISSEKKRSPGAVLDDIWNVILNHSTSFESEELVRVRITASTLDAQQVTSTHYFLVEDYVPPTVEQILTWDRRTLRVKFSERMTTTGSGPESIYFYRDVSGRVRYYRRYNVGTEVSPSWKYNVIEAPTANFSDGEVGCFLGSARAQNSVNNGAMTILERLSGSLVVVDGSLTDEGPADLTVETPPTLVLTSYRVVPKAVAAGVIQPVFSPIVVEASEVDPLTLAEGESTEEYVWLNFQDDLTPEVDYQLEVTKVEDSDGVPVGCLYDFTSWQPANVPNRRWDLFDMLPQMNRDADVSKDLERFIRCIDEVAHILLSDVDHFGHIYDPFYTKEEVLDILLAHLGNTLLFVGGLTAQKKRDLIPLLVPMYKQRGTAKGIEDAVSFFLSKTIIVAPWDAPADTWTLGVSLLGHNTYLGPSRSFVRYSFYVEHIDALTSAEESIIREIVEFVRPAHTHFVGFRQV